MAKVVDYEALKSKVDELAQNYKNVSDIYQEAYDRGKRHMAEFISCILDHYVINTDEG